ncbi:MAG: DNA polymerase III subunit gamma/tau [Bacteroidota bacterium]|nr:DNA polymerase III subunit gamma/tau [Bacteroidota bacterium]
MTDFIVSARKYRPETFKSVVGQQSITTTLKNSISGNQLAHAYLFCGPRGVGKTTCARIFSKTINCENPTDEFEACNECESCVAFNESRSYNIHELDAASNNSVEDIRNLIEQVRIPPQIGSHSVYIIDEVHMLSSAAFNAFLKTLEEPPNHAIFVLATTEKHKIIPTILSRCQIFDFNRISVNDAAKHLAYVAEQEKISVDSKALTAIAVKSDGAMRDALSFFDQIVSFSGKEISYQDAIDNLNVLDFEYYFKITEAFLNNDFKESLLIFNDILNKGFDGHHFITGLSSHFRDLLVCKDSSTIELFVSGDAIKKQYSEQSQNASVKFLFSALKVTNKTDLAYRTSQNKRLQVELALLEISKITEIPETSKATANSTQTQNKSESQVRKKTKKQEKKEDVKQKGTTSGVKLDTMPKEETPQEEHKEKETEVDFDNAWAELVSKFDKQPRLKAMLSSSSPEPDGNLILLKVAGSLQQEKLETLKAKMVRFLQSKTGNSNLDMQIIADKSAKSEVPYTQRDKYAFLAQKNKNLNRLKDELDLDQ